MHLHLQEGFPQLLVCQETGVSALVEKNVELKKANRCEALGPSG